MHIPGAGQKSRVDGEGQAGGKKYRATRGGLAATEPPGFRRPSRHDGTAHARVAEGTDHLAELAHAHPGHRIDEAVDGRVGLTTMGYGDDAHAFALRRLREDQREAAVAGDEADGFGHGRLQATGYGGKTP